MMSEAVESCADIHHRTSPTNLRWVKIENLN